VDQKLCDGALGMGGDIVGVRVVREAAGNEETAAG